jgi:predicted unusual protein kinase regulating ubiquinone biosynthesis (AarF/ABC1/UbiB family)
VNAASIGQVHKASKEGKQFAVKIQYPGVAESISSDLKMVKPIAARLFNISTKDLNLFMGEVESKLMEETDYALELRRSVEISAACGHIPNLVFPRYYPELSADRILVMDWLEGQHLPEFIKGNPDQVTRNRIGQALWDFYHFQMHELKQVHADPHPGNFIITPEGLLGVIDFGCVKVIPEDFYQKYFQLLRSDLLEDTVQMDTLFYDLDFLSPADSPREKELFTGIFKDMVRLLGKPFHQEVFDFGDDAYFREIFETGERVSRMKEVRDSRTARGPSDALYINRTYFGLYNILNQLKARVRTGGHTLDWLKSA